MKYAVIFMLVVMIFFAAYYFSSPETKMTVENTWFQIEIIASQIFAMATDFVGFLKTISLTTWIILGIIFAGLVTGISFGKAGTPAILAIAIFAVVAYGTWKLGLSMNDFVLEGTKAGQFTAAWLFSSIMSFFLFYAAKKRQSSDEEYETA